MRPAPLDFESLHAVLRAAGEGTRLRILALLAEAELTVSDLTKILRQSQPRISRHLKLLAEAGLVDRYREGSWAFYRLGERGGVADIWTMGPRCRSTPPAVVDSVIQGAGSGSPVAVAGSHRGPSSVIHAAVWHSDACT